MVFDATFDNISVMIGIPCWSNSYEQYNNRFDEFDLLCFNATFCNISAISCRPVLVVEEAGVPRENHRPWANNW